MPYMVRLFPLHSMETRRPVEEFPCRESLTSRLKSIGLSDVYLHSTLGNLEEGCDSMWANVKITPRTLDQFGRMDAAQQMVA